MQVSHAPAKTHAIFDEERLVAYAGLVPAMRLAGRCGLGVLAAGHVAVAGPPGVNAPQKIGSIVAGMLAGADSIDDLDALRHGGMGTLFSGIRAPSTPRLVPALPELGKRPPGREGAPGAAGPPRRVRPAAARRGWLAFLDLDSMQKRIYG